MSESPFTDKVRDDRRQSSFPYSNAFARNIGWVTPAEQNILRSKRIAIAGLGGVGGSHLLTLTRLGIGHFNIADLDKFEIANFNRQAGATLSHLGQPKVDVLVHLAREINPTLEIDTLPKGVFESNVDEFLTDVDLYIDGLDYFAVGPRRAVFAACRRKGIPAVTAAPLGMGVALLNFDSQSMSFEDYFQLEGQTEEEQLIRFLIGLSPAMLQRSYLVHPEAVNLWEHRGPSTSMACEMCAGLAATQALKYLLHRGPIVRAPRGMQFDAYQNRFVTTWRPRGNKNPIQKIALFIAKRQLSRMRDAGLEAKSVQNAGLESPIERVLNAARWAPSGDNSQAWQFEITKDNAAVVHGFDTRERCIYDLRGNASQLAIGAMLETLEISATGIGHRAQISRRTQEPDSRPTYDVELTADPAVKSSPLVPYIQVRTVQRKFYRTTRLSEREKATLQNAVGDAYSVRWLESFAERWAIAQLLLANAKLRMVTPEALKTHQDAIEWHATYSIDRVPDRALGLDPVGTRLSQWALSNASRMNFLNGIPGGTLLPRLQLDFGPALACAAHMVIVAEQPPESVDDYVSAGRAVQRAWLTVTKLGLLQQPEMTPLIFSNYVRNRIEFSRNPISNALAVKVASQLEAILTQEVVERAVWMGRVGRGNAPLARSLRKSLSALTTSAPKLAAET